MKEINATIFTGISRFGNENNAYATTIYIDKKCVNLPPCTVYGKNSNHALYLRALYSALCQIAESCPAETKCLVSFSTNDSVLLYEWKNQDFSDDIDLWQAIKRLLNKYPKLNLEIKTTLLEGVVSSEVRRGKRKSA